MSVEPANATNGERRRFFRIEDNIILFFREVDARELNQPLGAAEPIMDTFSLTAELDLLTLESRSQMRRIERDYPPVAEFLQVLEQKIDLVARAILANDPELSRQPTRRVSLSASGLAFESEENYALGSTLELKMVLPPEMVGVQARGRVVYSQQTRGEFPVYQVAVDFAELADKDRDLLIRHVVRKQMRHLRSRNQADAADAAPQNP